MNDFPNFVVENNLYGLDFFERNYMGEWIEKWQHVLFAYVYASL